MKKAFVIAGGSKGLGLALAREVYALGYPVALIARGNDALMKAKELIHKEIGMKQKLSIHAVDLSEPESAKKAFLEIQQEHGGLEVVVNSMATWIPRKNAYELQQEDVMKSIQLNFMTAFNTTREALSLHASDRKSKLAIINVGATASLRGGVQTGPFCLAKAALRSYSQSLAKELGPSGIHVAHVVVDGLIDNGRTRQLNPTVPDENYMNPVSIAKSIIHVAEQDRSCWTFEWDLRPNNEKW